MNKKVKYIVNEKFEPNIIKKNNNFEKMTNTSVKDLHENNIVSIIGENKYLENLNNNETLKLNYSYADYNFLNGNKSQGNGIGCIENSKEKDIRFGKRTRDINKNKNISSFNFNNYNFNYIHNPNINDLGYCMNLGNNNSDDFRFGGISTRILDKNN